MCFNARITHLHQSMLVHLQIGTGRRAESMKESACLMQQLATHCMHTARTMRSSCLYATHAVHLQHNAMKHQCVLAAATAQP